MKLFPIAAAAALFTLSAFGQTTNTVQAIRMTFTDEVGATNNTTINPDSDEAAGFQLNFLKDKMVAQQLTNPVPSFQNSIRGAARDRLLKPLALEALANDQKTKRVDDLWLYGAEWWKGKIFTPAQKQSLQDIRNSTNVTAVLP